MTQEGANNIRSYENKGSIGVKIMCISTQIFILNLCLKFKGAKLVKEGECPLPPKWRLDCYHVYNYNDVCFFSFCGMAQLKTERNISLYAYTISYYENDPRMCCSCCLFIASVFLCYFTLLSSPSPLVWNYKAMIGK